MSRLYETLTKVQNSRSASSSNDVVRPVATNTNGFPHEHHNGVEHPANLQRYVEPIRMDAAPTPGYGSLRDYWEVIVRHKLTLLCFAVTGLAGAILFSLVQAPIYRARTSLEIQNFNENFMDLKSMDPTNSSTEHFSTADTYLDTQIQIMQSEALIERVLNSLNLQESQPLTHWWSLGALKRRMFGAPKSSSPPGKEEMIRQAESNLT